MKILIPFALLFQMSSAYSSVIAVMDTGSDLSHQELQSKTWINLGEKSGSLEDLDNDGLPGDINGWDFIANSAKIFDDTYNYLIDEDVKTFLNYYSRYETGQISSDEFLWLKNHATDTNLMNKVNFVGGYAHGTHCAGIAAKNNDNAKIMSMKIIPTVYQELKAEPAPEQIKIKRETLDEVPVVKSFNEIKFEVIESAKQQLLEMAALNSFVRFHKVDVVNQSFGIGHNDAVSFITAGYQEELKKNPTEDEIKELTKAYFDEILANGPKVYQVASETLFTVAAGNDSSNNDLFVDYPANIEAPNKITVAATVGYSKLADFSNYGVNTVDVAAPGVAILSTVPTDSYLPMSGTSQATPFVANTISQIRDLNTSLSIADIKRIVLETVDVKDWLKDKVKTSGIVNKERAKRAAELAKTMSLDQSIIVAKKEIADVAQEKSFLRKKFNLGFKLRPVRPSLLIKK